MHVQQPLELLEFLSQKARDKQVGDGRTCPQHNARPAQRDIQEAPQSHALICYSEVYMEEQRETS